MTHTDAEAPPDAGVPPGAAPRSIALLGATGRTGRRVAEYALADELAVRALARVPAALAALAHPGLTVVEGDALDARVVAELVAGADAVVSALGGGTTAEPMAAAHVAAALAADGRSTGRVVVVAGGGILDALAGGLRQEQPTFPAIFRHVSAEHRRAWEVLRETSLAWTMVCTGDIVPGARTGEYRALADRMPEGGRRISIEDLAGFIVAELRGPRFVRRRVGLAY